MDERNSPWEVIKRIFSGKNAFLNTEFHIPSKKRNADEWSDNYKYDLVQDERLIRDNPLSNPVKKKPAIPNPLKDFRGRKVIPEIAYQRYSDYVSHDRLTLWVQVKNVSLVQLYMHRAEVLGVCREVGYIINPGQVQQLKIYDGPIPSTTAYNKVKLIYKELYSGQKDVFCACYVAKFSQFHDRSHYVFRGLMKNGPTQAWW